VIGLIIRPPSTTISSILIVIGLLFVAGAILFVRQPQKPKKGDL
jgi:predicted transporter